MNELDRVSFAKLHPLLRNCKLIAEINGTANRVLHLSDGERDYALRLMSPRRDAATPRQQERLIWLLLQQQGIAPTLLAWDARHQFCISDWHLHSLSPDLDIVLNALTHLHGCAAPAGTPKIDIEAGFQLYLEQLGVSPEPFVAHLEKLQQQVALSALSHVLCHNDLVAGNILMTEQGALFIDFEYAGLNHPYFDLCSVWTSLFEQQIPRHLVLRRYTELRNLPFDANEASAFDAAFQINSWLGLLWAKAKQTDWCLRFETQLRSNSSRETSNLLARLT